MTPATCKRARLCRLQGYHAASRGHNISFDLTSKFDIASAFPPPKPNGARNTNYVK